jgi:hypothetical protein
MMPKMAITLKNTATISRATTIVIAMLATALTIPTMTTVTFAQSSGNDFQEFMECLFGDVGGSSATAQVIEDVLQGNSADITEQKIRDCFSPIYNDSSGSSNSNSDDDGSNSDDNDGSADTGNSDDEEEGTEETDSTDNTDNTEGDGNTDETGTSGGNGDTTGDNTEYPDSSDDSTDNNTQ